MLEELKTDKRVVGLKQSQRAITDGRAKKVFLAQDVQSHIAEELKSLCTIHGAEIEPVQTMAELGKAVGIDVGAAVVVLLK